jgi:hypothetical protein
MNSVRVSTGELSLTEFYSAANGDDLVIQVLDLPSKLVGKFMFTPNSQSSQPHGSIVMVCSNNILDAFETSVTT